jgi:hypothetical protein
MMLQSLPERIFMYCMYEPIRDHFSLEFAIKSGEFGHPDAPHAPLYPSFKKDLCLVTDEEVADARRQFAGYKEKKADWEQKIAEWKSECSRIDERFRDSLEAVFGMSPCVSEGRRQLIWDEALKVKMDDARDNDLPQDGIVKRLAVFEKYGDYAHITHKILNS